jgi:NAD(P)-dependent dehydrogenase (short-subunit alcohol dehydrogenase family)
MDANTAPQATTSLERKYSLANDATYVIAGGLGGLGRSTARWMASRGARALLLLSRAGATSDESKQFLRDLRSQGVQVEAPPCDVGDMGNVRAVLQTYKDTMPPIKGCVQASMSLRVCFVTEKHNRTLLTKDQDSSIENMTYADFNEPLQSKVNGSWNLHTLLPSALDFFILFSSVTGIYGKGGQANYAAGNTYQDTLARYRVSHGQNALSINLGAMESVGWLSRDVGRLDRLVATDSLQRITQDAFFAILEHACQGDSLRGQSQLITGLGIPAILRTHGKPTAEWLNRPIFRALHRITHKEGTVKAEPGTEGSRSIDLAQVFQKTNDSKQRNILVAEALKMRINRVLPGTFNADDEGAGAKRGVPLHSLGVDSLVSIDLRTWFTRELKADVTTFEILGNMDVQEVATLAVARSQISDEKTPGMQPG